MNIKRIQWGYNKTLGGDTPPDRQTRQRNKIKRNIRNRMLKESIEERRKVKKLKETELKRKATRLRNRKHRIKFSEIYEYNFKRCLAEFNHRNKST